MRSLMGIYVNKPKVFFFGRPTKFAKNIILAKIPCKIHDKEKW